MQQQQSAVMRLNRARIRWGSCVISSANRSLILCPKLSYHQPQTPFEEEVKTPVLSRRTDIEDGPAVAVFDYDPFV